MIYEYGVGRGITGHCCGAGPGGGGGAVFGSGAGGAECRAGAGLPAATVCCQGLQCGGAGW